MLGEFFLFATTACLLSVMRIESVRAVMVLWFLVLEPNGDRLDGVQTVLTAFTDLPGVTGMNR